MSAIEISTRVQNALASGRPVVALESTIFSHLGLPSPANAQALESCSHAIRHAGAEPAVTAIIDGRIRVGLEDDETERILGPGRKVAERDIAVAVGQQWEFGATTVSAAVSIAAAAGVKVFATGGIGGVHRGAEITGDISADLGAIARYPVVTVSAGAKPFLDLARTLEYFETSGVPVLGWCHDWFPAFYTRSSGLPVPTRVDSVDEVAAIFTHRIRSAGGLVVAVPIPEADELDVEVVNGAIEQALAECQEQGITGAEVTPYVLAALGRSTKGQSVPANLALATNNARVAGDIAVALAAIAT